MKQQQRQKCNEKPILIHVRRTLVPSSTIQFPFCVHYQLHMQAPHGQLHIHK